MKVYVVDRRCEGYEGIYATLEAAQKAFPGTWNGPFSQERYNVGDTEIVSQFQPRWHLQGDELNIYEEEVQG